MYIFPHIPHIKIYSKWIKHLNVRAKTTKLFKENRTKSFSPWIWQWILIYDTKTGYKQTNKQKQ